MDLQRDLKLSSQSIFSSQQSTFVILYVLYTTLSRPHMWDYTGFFVVVVVVIFCCCCRHRLRLSPSKTDVSLFTCNSCGIIAYVFLYVDNIILTGTMTGSSLPLLLNWVAPSLLEYGWSNFLPQHSSEMIVFQTGALSNPVCAQSFGQRRHAQWQTSSHSNGD